LPLLPQFDFVFLRLGKFRIALFQQAMLFCRFKLRLGQFVRQRLASILGFGRGGIRSFGFP